MIPKAAKATPPISGFTQPSSIIAIPPAREIAILYLVARALLHTIDAVKIVEKSQQQAIII
jgi:hypothetical protein